MTKFLSLSKDGNLEKGLLPSERARMLRSWKRSGFNLHRSRRMAPDEGLGGGSSPLPELRAGDADKSL